ncbi:MAG: acylneuraminate cytidylyltransferase family protein [Burkholderiales bacterium]|nr:acylneuraminate cytidylyltransferase family protein [Burkholderiales bacterium]
MTWDGMKVLAVIPARGGSKSIPRKNLARIEGVSLVGWASRVARAASWIDHVVLSTDDEEIASEGRACGIDVPFMRPVDLAGDRSSSADMWRHAWTQSERHYGVRFDCSLLLEPTSPLRSVADLERTIAALMLNGHEAAATVSRTPAHYTPHKTLVLDTEGRIGFYLPEGARHSIRQTIPAYYHRNGICYAVRRETLFEHGAIVERNCAAVIIERPVVNIDEPLDLRLAGLLMADALASQGEQGPA